MAEAIEQKTLEKLNHLEKMAESIYEEIKETKSLFQKKVFASLCGILKGVKISEKDIKEAKESIFKTNIEL